MNQQTQDILIKVRSYRSVMAAAFRLYTKSIQSMTFRLALFIALPTLAYILVTIFTIYGFYVFMPMLFAGILLEMLLWWKAGSFITKRSMRSLWKPARRHGFTLFATVLGGLLLMIIPSIVVSLPLGVITLAEWNYLSDIEIGDQPVHPDYINYLVAFACLLAYGLQVVLRLYIVPLAYFAWGSSEARHIERQQQIASLTHS